MAAAPRPAGFWIRAAAYVIDSVIVLLMSVVAAVVVVALVGESSVGSVLYEVVAFAFALGLAHFTYSTYFWSRHGWTPGMLAYMVAFDPRRQGLHDKLAETLVLREP